MTIPVSINASKIDVLAYARSVNKEESFFEALSEIFSDTGCSFDVESIRSMFLIDATTSLPLFTHIFFDSRGMIDGADLGTVQKLDMQTKTITGQEMFEVIMGKVKPTIHNAAFLTKDVDIAKIQALIEICHKQGKTFWESAEDFMSFILSNEDKHITFFSDSCGINGDSAGLAENRVLVSYERFLELLKEHYDTTEQPPVKNPRPRFRKRRRQKATVAKTIVRVLYTTQQVYTFKNVSNIQIIDDKVFVQYDREITEGIKESVESAIDGDLVMAVVVHEVGNRSNFFRNIDGTWDFQAEDGTVVNSGKQLGRVFKK